MVKPQYIIELKEMLPNKILAYIAGELEVTPSYLYKILSGNRGRDLKSEKALEVVRYVENYILSNGLQYLPPLDYLGIAIKIYISRGSEKPYAEAIREVFTTCYSPVISFNSNLFLN